MRRRGRRRRETPTSISTRRRACRSFSTAAATARARALLLDRCRRPRRFRRGRSALRRPPAILSATSRLRATSTMSSTGKGRPPPRALVDGGGGRQPPDVTGLAGALPAAGDPSVIIDTARGENIVFYRASDGHIHDVYWSTGPAGHENLSGFAGAPQAAGDPFAFYTPHNDMRQVTIAAPTGTSTSSIRRGSTPVSHWDLTADRGRPCRG